MKKSLLIFAAVSGLFLTSQPDQLNAHCQMPCGIYHDELVFGQIDQYVETMYKGLSVLTNNDFKTLHDKNEFIRWVYLKEKNSDEIANLFLTYFLQQKIKPGEDGEGKRLNSLHKLVFMLVQIKQHIDVQMILDFNLEWEVFKHMFHPDGYQCAKTKQTLEEWAEWDKEHKSQEEKSKQLVPSNSNEKKPEQAQSPLLNKPNKPATTNK